MTTLDFFSDTPRDETPAAEVQAQHGQRTDLEVDRGQGERLPAPGAGVVGRPPESAPISFFAKVQSQFEDHRHACECRYVAAMPAHARRGVYLDGVWQQRGKEAYLRLRADVWALVKLAERAA